MYEDLLKEFKTWVVNDKQAQSYWDKVNNGTASYKDATDYSYLVGDKISELVVSSYGELNPETIDEIKSALGKAYSESSWYSQYVQENINEKANVSIKAIRPKQDKNRINNLLNKMEEEIEADKDETWLLKKEVVENIAREAVTDTIMANGRTQSEAGLQSYVIRTGINCCDWCASVSGKYKLGEQPADFWKVHKGCTCTIDYKIDKSPVQKIRFISGKKITL